MLVNDHEYNSWDVIWRIVKVVYFGRENSSTIDFSGSWWSGTSFHPDKITRECGAHSFFPIRFTALLTVNSLFKFQAVHGALKTLDGYNEWVRDILLNYWSGNTDIPARFWNQGCRKINGLLWRCGRQWSMSFLVHKSSSAGSASRANIKVLEEHACQAASVEGMFLVGILHRRMSRQSE